MSAFATAPLSDSATAQELSAAARDLSLVKTALSEVIYGQEQVIELALTALLSGGHALLVGMPGVAKTLLVSSLATVLGLSSKRIQCTPDLMPSDILGSEILDEAAGGKRSFRFLPGPVFCQLLMADEINRASPRTQSALLQAMQEHVVTVAGENHVLPNPFLVLATQNPIEHEGTYPLPEAQLDRFIMQIDVPYPSRAAEKTLLLRTTGAALPVAKPVLSAERVIALQQLVRRLPIGDAVVEAILSLLAACRPQSDRRLTWGPGPRAGQALMLAARARAMLDGRPAPSLDDIRTLATPVLSHRLALTYAAAAEGATTASVIADACQCLCVTLPDSALLNDAMELSRRFPPLKLTRISALPHEGAQAQKRAGSGDAFWQYRPYTTGENAGAIDWRASARREHPLIREKEQATPARLRLWLDGSPSMAYSSQTAYRSKGDTGALLLTALADQLKRGGDEAQAGRLPGNSPAKILAHLTHRHAWHDPLPSPAGKLCVIASDFLFDPGAVERALNSGKGGVLLHLVDPAEERFPFRGTARFEGLEAEDALLLEDARASRDDYLERWHRHIHALETMAARHGFIYLRHVTHTPLPITMAALRAALKARGKR